MDADHALVGELRRRDVLGESRELPNLLLDAIVGVQVVEAVVVRQEEQLGADPALDHVGGVALRLRVGDGRGPGLGAVEVHAHQLHAIAIALDLRVEVDRAPVGREVWRSPGELELRGIADDLLLATAADLADPQARAKRGLLARARQVGDPLLPLVEAEPVDVVVKRDLLEVTRLGLERPQVHLLVVARVGVQPQRPGLLVGPDRPQASLRPVRVPDRRAAGQLEGPLVGHRERPQRVRVARLVVEELTGLEAAAKTRVRKTDEERLEVDFAIEVAGDAGACELGRLGRRLLGGDVAVGRLGLRVGSCDVGRRAGDQREQAEVTASHEGDTTVTLPERARWAIRGS